MTTALQPQLSASTSKESKWKPMPPKPLDFSLLRVSLTGNTFVPPQKPIVGRASSFLSIRRFGCPTAFEALRGLRGVGLYSRSMAPPRPELEKQYMSSNSKPKKETAEPRPSARPAPLFSLYFLSNISPVSSSYPPPTKSSSSTAFERQVPFPPRTFSRAGIYQSHKMETSQARKTRRDM